MPESQYKMIAGLGNPGGEYARTRHNMGFLVVEALAGTKNLSLDKSRFDAQYTRTRLQGFDVFLLQPMSYMNRSGIPIQKFSSFYKIALSDIIVVHDDMDLEFAKIKIVQNRGHGGHNGVRSIIEAFGKRDCIRVRVGVGHPGGRSDVTGHVLGRFSPEEKEQLDECVENAVKACLTILEKGLTRAMNQVNTRR